MHAPSDMVHFDAILAYLQQARGFDFNAYKRTTLLRRVLKRMSVVGIETFEEYRDFLEAHADEFGELFNTILVNVTGFFRDRDVWEHLRAQLLPELMRTRDELAPLRIWSAGAASGQEAYSLAMLLAEIVGAETLRERVKIYATDADHGILSEARQAAYTPRAISDVPPELLDKYFERSGSNYVVHRDLRRAVIFGRHDLLQDAPISKVDLLLCRNTLMYFNTDAQARVLSRFHFSLAERGYLLLGRAEMLFSHTALFAPVDLKRRLFRRIPLGSHRDRLLLFNPAGREVDGTAEHIRLREVAFDTDVLPQIIVDGAGTLVAANATARQRFGLAKNDVGRAIRDLELSHGLAELRAALDRGSGDNIPPLEFQRAVDGEQRQFRAVATPLAGEDGSNGGTLVSFHDVTEIRNLQQQLQQSKQELETAYEELQSTNEELETTNEELQSTVEELETTNEELQSTNEELETMNEELQSTNEELQTMNDELRSRSADLNSSNAFLASVFASLRSAVIVIDSEFIVRIWNGRAEDLWGVRRDEACGHHLLALDIGLPVAEMKGPIREVLAGSKTSQEVEVNATTRRGKSLACQVSITPLAGSGGPIIGAILLIDERPVAH